MPPRGAQCDTIDTELAEIIEARDKKNTAAADVSDDARPGSRTALIQKAKGLRTILKTLTSYSFLKPFVCIGPIHFLFRS